MISGSLSTPLQLAAFVGKIFEDLGVQYVLGGSLASSILGEPRSTNDIDFAVQFDEKTVRQFVDRLGKDFYVNLDTVIESVKQGSSFNVIHHETVQKIDIFILKTDAFAVDQLKRRKRVQVSESPKLDIYVASGEDIVLNKLLWFKKTGLTSDRQWKDVEAVIRIQKGHLDHNYLVKWATHFGIQDLLAKVCEEQ